MSSDQFEPYRLLWAPVYFELRKNQKLLLWKKPLDFFTPEEIEKAKSIGSLHVPIDARIREVSSVAYRIHDYLKSVVAMETKPPYLVAKGIREEISTLFVERKNLDPFHIVVFSGTLCAPLTPQTILRLRDRDLDHFEHALRRASFAVLTALLLEYCNLGFLQALFHRAISLSTNEERDVEPRSGAAEEEEILRFAFSCVPEQTQGDIAIQGIQEMNGRVAAKFQQAWMEAKSA